MLLLPEDSSYFDLLNIYCTGLLNTGDYSNHRDSDSADGGHETSTQKNLHYMQNVVNALIKA